jgi:Fe-S-cluster containining protein
VEFECTSCGCCCFSTAPEYIRVFEVDEARMGGAELAFTEEVEGKRVMRFRDGRCGALEVRDGRYLCSIYEMRPDACRWLEPGSGACREHIRDKREEISLVSLRLRSA